MTRKNDEMLDEYDLSGKIGVRGKYAEAYKTGHSVRVFDGYDLVSDTYFASIEPDVRAYFPDSKSINKALREIISSIPEKEFDRKKHTSD